MAVKVELISKEVVRPASPAPRHFRALQLSLIDQMTMNNYIDAIFFYDKTSDQNQTVVSTALKNSLSETLTRFYPLAGRMEGGASVNCSDEGALFTEARADVILSDFLRYPNADSLNQLVMDPSDSLDPCTWPLLHVKVSFFRNGGVAIAVSLSHKIFDMDSFVRFVRSWAATAQGRSGTVERPEFIASTFFPLADLSLEVRPDEKPGGKYTTRRFVFSPSKIKELKIQAASEQVPDPTRVEAAMAVLFKAIKASRSNDKLMMLHAINVRTRIPPTLLAENATGNFLHIPFLDETSKRSESEIRQTVSKIRKTKEEFSKMIKGHLQGTRTIEELGERIALEVFSSARKLRKEMMNTVITSSWCRMRIYEVDFGWGNPVWVANHYSEASRICVLADTNDGEGVEAWVPLPERDMLRLEHDKGLLAFATPNPSVLI